MRSLFTKAGVIACAGALAFALAGCAAMNTAGNDQLAFTGANTSEVQTFDTVTFGSYPQSGTNNEPIEWLKLDEKDGKTLLISQSVLDAVPYEDATAGYAWAVNSPRPTEDVEWADCSLRAWLNDTFYNAAFSADEQKAIAATANDDVKHNVAPTADRAADPTFHQAAASTDDVFLLSVAEAKKYFKNDVARVAQPTDYAVSHGVYMGTANAAEQVHDATIWWLRTHGYYSGYAAVVTDDGYVHGDGYRVDGEMHDGYDDHGTQASELGGNIGVRPCIWVETTALS